MEGYSMFEDGYVLDVKTTICSSDNGQHDKYFAIISNGVLYNGTNFGM
jgi:hypothetical protein